MEPLISAKDLKKNFGKVEALKGVSLDVAEGEKVVVIGPSGSGWKQKRAHPFHQRP